MKFYILFITLFVVSQASSINIKINENLNEEWELFKNQFNKKYTNAIDELNKRLVWEEKVQDILKHNIEYDMGKRSYKLGINEFSDMTHDEFKARYLNFKFSPENITKGAFTFRTPLNMNELPPSVDWRTKGYVTPVKNQGQCGSCWSFSTTGTLEGQHFRATHKLLSFSEQQLVDCADSFGPQGCNGGYPSDALKYISKFGIETEKSYPYTAQDGDCKYNKNKVVASCKGVVALPKGNEKTLQVATATVGPISICIDASDSSFMNYKSGVYTSNKCTPNNLDHAVLIVGYGTENGQKYWLVKNSWGTSWGLKGYIKMSRDKNNQCGIASLPVYPIV